jgi:hypothetical protein
MAASIGKPGEGEMLAVSQGGALVKTLFEKI